MDLNKEWEKFSKSNTESKKDSFVEYCLKNIEANNSNILTVRQASYNICAACMNIKDNTSESIKNFEIIQNISCELELPDEHRSIPLDEWDNLKKLIENI